MQRVEMVFKDPGRDVSIINGGKSRYEGKGHFNELSADVRYRATQITGKGFLETTRFLPWWCCRHFNSDDFVSAWASTH